MPPDAPEVDDGPDTDGCEVDFAQHADHELTASLRPLFPDGVAHDDWAQLFGDVTPA